jgi:hypothetical protein
VRPFNSNAAVRPCLEFCDALAAGGERAGWPGYREAARSDTPAAGSTCSGKDTVETNVADPDPPDSIGSVDLKPGNQKWHKKVEKKLWKISCFEVLDVLVWELKASSVTWTSFMEA